MTVLGAQAVLPNQAYDRKGNGPSRAQYISARRSGQDKLKPTTTCGRGIVNQHFLQSGSEIYCLLEINYDRRIIS